MKTGALFCDSAGW